MPYHSTARVTRLFISTTAQELLKSSRRRQEVVESCCSCQELLRSSRAAAIVQSCCTRQQLPQSSRTIAIIKCFHSRQESCYEVLAKKSFQFSLASHNTAHNTRSLTAIAVWGSFLMILRWKRSGCQELLPFHSIARVTRLFISTTAQELLK